MNDLQLTERQIQRERELNTIAFERWKTDINDQEKKSDASNTPFARQWKHLIFDLIVKGLQAEIDDPSRIRNSVATKAVRECIGVSLTYKKDPKTGEKIVEEKMENQFDLELAVFVTLQLILDNALAPEMKTTTVDKSKGGNRVCHPAIDRTGLIERIGSRIEQQIAFKYIEACFPKYFKNLDSVVAGGKDGKARSSSYYWRVNMTRAIKKKADALRLEGKDEEANRYEWKPFGANKKHIGSWLLEGCLKYCWVKPNNAKEPHKLFAEATRQITPTKKGVFIVLSKEADQMRRMYLANHEMFILDDLPMLCPPVEATNDNYGSWLLGASLTKPSDHKGEVSLSPSMLAYINNLQKVSYKINTFVLSVMDLLVKKNVGLGSFKPHFYVEPQDIKQSLGVIDTGDYEEDYKTLEALGDKFKQAKRDKSDAKAREIEKTQKGRQSLQVFRNALKLAKDEKFYYPYQWDFRSRVYCRSTTSPQPQGPDYSKACIRFGEETPVDDDTPRYLAVELANHAGMDKVSFHDRIEWVNQNTRNITLVATMMEPNGDINGALEFLEGMSSPWQFLCSAEEFYHCFIIGDRKTTSIRCSVDMSCSGAGIHAGWKLDATDAEAVNVTPSDTPQDLYMRVFKALQDVNDGSIRPDLLQTWVEQGYARKASKRMIMVLQYSAGIKKQLEEFDDVHKDFPTHLQLTDEERMSLFKLWKKATSKAMSVDSVINWFQARVKEIHKSGKTVVLIPNATGCIQTMKYPHYETKQVMSFHNGRFTESHPTGEADLKAWKRSITANATHMCDSAIMCIAFQDFPHSFSTIHDASHTYASSAMTDMVTRLKRGYIEAVGLNIWDEFRKLNGIDTNNKATDFIQTKTLDLNDVMKSQYIFA